VLWSYLCGRVTHQSLR